MVNKEFLIQQWTAETKATVNCIKAVPDEKADYKPNPKTRSAKELISHLAGEINDMMNMITNGAIAHVPVTYTTSAEIASQYEATTKLFLEKLSAIDEQTWNAKLIPLSFGDTKVYEAPMAAMAWTYFKDLIHHRGQLSTYFRPMGARNPSIYGPTAESIEEMAATNKN